MDGWHDVAPGARSRSTSSGNHAVAEVVEHRPSGRRTERDDDEPRRSREFRQESRPTSEDCGLPRRGRHGQTRDGIDDENVVEAETRLVCDLVEELPGWTDERPTHLDLAPSGCLANQNRRALWIATRPNSDPLPVRATLTPLD